MNKRLSRQTTGLLLIDVQIALWPTIDRTCEVGQTCQAMIRAARILQLPIIVTEQLPDKLGGTIPALASLLPPEAAIFPKSTFSACKDPAIAKAIQESGREQWIVIGVEAHICVLQTAKDLLASGLQPVVLNDAISSRSVFNFSTAIAEMRDAHCRVSCLETVLFELLEDAEAEEFKAILALVK